MYPLLILFYHGFYKLVIWFCITKSLLILNNKKGMIMKRMNKLLFIGLTTSILSDTSDSLSENVGVVHCSDGDIYK